MHLVVGDDPVGRGCGLMIESASAAAQLHMLSSAIGVRLAECLITCTLYSLCQLLHMLPATNNAACLLVELPVLSVLAALLMTSLLKYNSWCSLGM